MSSARATLVGVLLSAALAVALAARQPDLRPNMPEVDGVHPARALVALHDAYAPGVGFLDKYPPLGSFLFGLAAAAGDVKGLSEQALAITTAPAEVRRVQLWALRDEVQGALERERWLSRLALAGAAALVFLLARRLGGVSGAAGRLEMAGPLLAGCLFAASPTARVYAGTANVDALALLPALGALLLLFHGRWAASGAAVALAVALKDPQVVLLPVLLGGAAWLGGRRALLRAAVAAAVVYVVASGALTSPSVWWEHVRYLTGGGVENVDRLDHASLASWFRLLSHVGWLVRENGSSLWLFVLAVALWPRAALDAREAVLTWAAALAPIVLFVLPVGFAYARFLLVTQALLAAWLGALGVYLVRRASNSPVRWRWLMPAAFLLLLVSTLGRRVLPWPGADVESDPRRSVVTWLDQHDPHGGRCLLFADEREHGPPLDPTRWEFDARGLGETGPALAALRDGPAAQRPDWVLVMSFGNDLPSGAPRLEAPPAKPGDLVGGMYTVREVLGEPPRSWEERAIATRPLITILQRAD